MAKERAKKSVAETNAAALVALGSWVVSAKGRASLQRAARAAASDRRRLAESLRVSVDQLRARVTL